MCIIMIMPILSRGEGISVVIIKKCHIRQGRRR